MIIIILDSDILHWCFYFVRPTYRLELRNVIIFQKLEIDFRQDFDVVFFSRKFMEQACKETS